MISDWPNAGVDATHRCQPPADRASLLRAEVEGKILLFLVELAEGLALLLV